MLTFTIRRLVLAVPTLLFISLLLNLSFLTEFSILIFFFAIFIFIIYKDTFLKYRLQQLQ